VSNRKQTDCIKIKMSDELEAADIWGDSNDQHGQSGGSIQESTSAQQQQQQEETSQESKEDEDTITMSITDLRQRIRLLDNDIRVMKSDIQRISHESRAQKDRIRDNVEKVKMNKQLPYLVGNVIEILEPEAEDGELS
jgi:ATP-dependent 26S proteasome regulatory subunit